MNSNLSYSDQFVVCSRIEQEIREHDLSLLRIDEGRLKLAMRLTEFNDLRRLIARRKRIPALLEAPTRSPNQTRRRVGDVRQRRV